MKTALKIIGAVLGLMVVLVLAAPLLVKAFVDPNDYKPRIEALVREHTGRELRIGGDIGVSVFPWLGVKLGAVELGNAPGFDPPLFARLEAAQVRVKLLPLLGQQVEMDTVTVDGLTLNLARDAQGRFNWDDLAAAGGSRPEAGGGPPPVAALAIGGVHLRGARVTWDDAQAGVRYEVSDLELKTGALAPGEPVDLSFVARVAGGEPALGAILDGRARIGLDLAARRYRASGLVLTADLTGAPLPGGRARVALAGDASFDEPNRTVQVTGLDLRVTEIELDGRRVAVSLRAEAGGNLATQLYTARGLNVGATLSGEGLPGGQVEARLGGDAGLDLAGGRLALSALSLEAAGLRAGGDVVVSDLLGSPRVAGALKVEPFAPRTVLASLGVAVPDTSDPKALARASLSTEVAGSLAKVTLAPLTLTVDDTTVSGTLSATTRKVPAVRFDLAVNGIDLDRYLAPAAKASATPATAAAAGGGALPLEILRSVDVAGELKVGRLKASGVTMSDLSAKLQIAEGVARMRPVTAKLYGGRYEGGVVLDARGRNPSITVDEKLTGVSFGPLLQALAIQDPGIGLDGASGDVGLKAQASGDPAGQRFEFKGALLSANLTGKALPSGRLQASVGGDVALDLAADQVKVGDLRVDALGVKATGEVTARGLRGAPSAEGRLAVAPFNARTLLKNLGQKAPDTADPKALSAVALDAGFSGSATSLRLDPLSLRLDDSRVSGTVDVVDLARQAVRFDLAVDGIDLDRYLPPGAPPQAASPGAAAGAAGGVPVETLRALDADGQLRVGRLVMSNLKFEDIRLTLKAKDGQIRLHPATARLYDGAYAGNVALDATGAQPRVSLDEVLTDVQAGPLLRDLNGSDRITGRAEASLRLSAVATDATTAKRTLNGTVDFRFRDGTIKGIDIVQWMCQVAQARGGGSDLKSAAIGALIGQVARGARTDAGAASDGATRFSEARGTFDIRDGVARNDDLDVRSPLLRLSGNGVVDLVAEQIDYTATPVLVSSCQGQGGAGADDLSGTPVPVRISGSFAKPSYSPDLGALLSVLKRRPRPAEPAPSPAQVATPPAPAEPPPAEPQRPKDVLKEQAGEALKGILQGIFK